MASLFSKPKMPEITPQKLPEITPTPTIDDATQLASKEMEALKKKGRRSTVLSDQTAEAGVPDVGVKTLLG